MAQVDIALMRQHAALARQDYERQTTTSSSDGIAGIPEVSGSTVLDWGTPAGWEAFKAERGFYPFGMQGGGQVLPPSWADAPDWVYEKIGLRRPPVTVSPGSA